MDVTPLVIVILINFFAWQICRPLKAFRNVMTLTLLAAPNIAVIKLFNPHPSGSSLLM